MVKIDRREISALIIVLGLSLGDTQPGFAASPEPCLGRHIVTAGENLSKIAAQLKISPTRIAACNPQIPNKNLIHPGELIFTPIQSEPVVRPTAKPPEIVKSQPSGLTPDDPKDFDASPVVSVTIPKNTSLYGERTNRLAHFEIFQNGGVGRVTITVYGPEKKDQVMAGILSPWTGVLTPNKFTNADASWSGGNVSTINRKWILRMENSSNDSETVTITTSDRQTGCDNSYAIDETIGSSSKIIHWIFCNDPNKK